MDRLRFGAIQESSRELECVNVTNSGRIFYDESVIDGYERAVVLKPYSDDVVMPSRGRSGFPTRSIMWFGKARRSLDSERYVTFFTQMAIAL
jgi:hypothetical protein